MNEQATFDRVTRIFTSKPDHSNFTLLVYLLSNNASKSSSSSFFGSDVSSFSAI